MEINGEHPAMIRAHRVRTLRTRFQIRTTVGYSFITAIAPRIIVTTLDASESGSCRRMPGAASSREVRSA